MIYFLTLKNNEQFYIGSKEVEKIICWYDDDGVPLKYAVKYKSDNKQLIIPGHSALYHGEKSE